MSTVDDRIVNMQFNNKQFVAGATESKAALDGLEKTLANTARSKGLEDMGSKVDGIKAKFTALQVVGVAALASIATKALDAGMNFIKGFSGMQSMMDGFQEYELKMGSIQTIMANTGKPLEAVNRNLEQLNKYSDKTIYNFADMTKNIGLFTNAGIGLKDATNMIQGFSNEAAVSGTNAQQAAGAAYQLSQALNAGTIRLMDWRSLQNVGMGNKNMQEGLIELADSMGKFKGQSETAQLAAQNFNGSLEKNWLSADVMSNYLQIKAGKLSDAQMKNLGLTDQQIKKFKDQAKVAEEAATKVRTWTQLTGTIKEQLGSGWAKSMELIIGDFNEATELFTNINDAVGGVIGKMSDSRNAMLKDWADQGGREMLFDSLGRIATSLGSIFKTVGQAFRDVFPPSSENLLLKITEGFEKFSKTLVPSKGTLESLRGIFGGVFSVLKIGAGIIGGVGLAVAKLIGALGGLSSGASSAGGGILSILGSTGDVIVGFQKWLTESVNITEVLGDIGEVAGAVLRPIVSLIDMVRTAIGNLVSGGGIEGFLEPFESAKGVFSQLVANIAGALASLTSPFEEISSFFAGIQSKFTGLAEAFANPFERGLSRVEAFKEAVGGISSGNMTAAGESIAIGFDKVRRSTDSARTAVTGMYESFRGPAAAAAEDASVELAAAGDRAKERWGSVKDVMTSLGSGLKDVFSKLGEAASWVRDQFSDLFGGMDAIEWASLMNAFLTGGLLVALKKGVDATTSFKDVLGSINDTIGALTGTLEAMQKEIKAKAIMNIAIAVALLTASVVALSFVDAKKLGVSLGAIGVMLGMLVGSLAALGKINSEMNISIIALSILMISAAMVNLALAVILLGKQDLGTLAKGLGAMAIGLGLMVAAVNKMSGITGKLVAAGAGMILIATAMSILAGAVAIFGNMSMETLGKGFGSIAIGLQLIVSSLIRLVSMGPGVLAASAAIMVVASALVVLSVAVAAFGNMDIETLAVGFGAIAVGLGLMVLALGALAPMAPQVLIVAQSMAILSLAMIGLAIAVGMFGTMDMQTLAVGFAAVALGLGILLAAAALAQAVAPGLVILSTSIMMLGAAMALAGLGMLMFGTGFAILATAGVAGVAVISAAIEAFIAMLPSIAVQMAAAFVAFIDVIAKASPKLRKSFGEIFKNFLGVVTDAIPELRKLLQTLIDNAIRVIKDSVPQWVEMGFTIIDKFLESAAKHVPKMAENAVKLMTNFLKALEKEIPKLQDQAAKTIVAFIQGAADAINNNVDDLRAAGGDLAMAIINGLTGGLLSEGIAMVQNAASRLAAAIPGPIRKFLGIDSPSKVTMALGRWVAKGMAVGITQGIKDAVAAAISMANAIIAAGDSKIAEAQSKAAAAQKAADAADAKADITAKRAAAARKKANKFAKENPKNKKAIREQEKATLKLERLATKQRTAADKAQTAADKSAQNVVDVRAFQDADLIGKGDIKQDQAVALADQANKMLAKANAEAAEAKRLQKINKKAARAMLAQSRKDAAEAARLAAEAQTANQVANDYYEMEVAERIRQLEEDAAYEAANDAGKAAILQARAKANDAKAQAAKAESAALVAQAKAIAESDAAQALRLVEQAEKAARIAEDAAEQAKREREEAEALLKPPDTPDTSDSTGGSTGGSAPTIQLSRSILEDAASAMDRYTASLQQAEELAASQPGVVQFVQHNTSPEALSASEIYRQSKNLLSSAEIKMGANSATT